jgi:hypothetical protein
MPRIIALALLLGACPAQAQLLVVGDGSRLSLGDATLQAGCADIRVDGAVDVAAGSLLGAGDVRVDGVLNGGSGTVALSGDLAAPGLLPQSGTVRIESGCASAGSTLTGSHLFNRLSVANTSAYALTLPAGVTQTITTGLVLQGGSERLVMRSTTPGLVGGLLLLEGGSQAISRVDAIDVGAPEPGQYLAEVYPASIDSIDRGNTPRFLGILGSDDPVPLPTLDGFWLGLLALLIGVPAVRHLRTRASF